MRALFTLCALWVALMPSLALAQNPRLEQTLTDCWDAVDGKGLATLMRYDMQFDRIDRPSSTAENHIWRGYLQTEFGDLEVHASIRDNVLFDCTILRPPETAGRTPITYDDAEHTVSAWFTRKLEQRHHFERLADIRFWGVVRCAPGAPVISANATSLFPVDPAILAKDRTEPIEGTLRIAMFRTSPKNFDFCDVGETI